MLFIGLAFASFTRSNFRNGICRSGGKRTTEGMQRLSGYARETIKKYRALAEQLFTLSDTRAKVSTEGDPHKALNYMLETRVTFNEEAADMRGRLIAKSLLFSANFSQVGTYSSQND